MLKFIKFKEGTKQPEYIDGEVPWGTSLDTFKDAGIWIPKDIVVIDFDAHNEEEQKQMKVIEDQILAKYPTFWVQATRGKHLYYKKPENLSKKIACITVTGFKVDYLTGKTQPECLKQNGVVRKTSSNITNLDFKELPDLPVELLPVPKSKDNNMLCMKEGDRNNTIYKHLLCVKEMYPEADLKEITEFINNYVFAEKCEGKEYKALLATVDSALNKKENPNNYNGNPKDMISFAEWLVKKLDIKYYKGKLYFNDGNYHISNNTLLLREVTKYLKLKHTQDNELIHQLNKFAIIEKENRNLPIRVINGTISDGEFMNVTENIFTVFNLNVEYKPEIYDEHVDKFLNDITCNRKELRNVLEEILGHILMIHNFPHHVFFLKGNGKNGKSTFLEMINEFVGECGDQISLEDFNDATSVSSLIGKLVNCSDETDQVFIDRCKGYKSLASGNTIKVRPIYSQSIQVINTATLILNANKMPNFKDKTGGFFRRLMIIPFDYDLEKENKIEENLLEKLSTPNAKSYILNLALDGYKRIKSNGNKMSYSELIENEKLNYRMETDSVIAYLDEFKNIDGKVASSVYLQYQVYVEDIGKIAVSRAEFTSRLKDFGYECKIQWVSELKKSVRCYVKTLQK